MNVLTIGGSDPSGGAGIQSDIEYFTTFNIHTFSVITAITQQNTTSFGKVQKIKNSMIKNQLESIFSDFEINGIKIGMVYDSEIIKIISKYLKNKKVPIVLDPVIKSTTGGILLKKSAIQDFIKYLIPISTVITPNLNEAEIISKIKLSDKNSIEKIGKIIQSKGIKNVIITGIKNKENEICDYVFENNRSYLIKSQNIPIENHGSGGIFAASILNYLMKDKNLRESTKFAKKITLHAIKNSKVIGKGINITQISKTDQIISDLFNSITEFSQIPKISEKIPECQTNFVFSKVKPKNIKDIVGVSGRIVKSDKQVIVAGELRYGASKHVATAVLEINKKFPEIRSAINIKFEKSMIKKMENKQFIIEFYDRSKEPGKNKSKGSSIEWGIKNAIKNSNEPPDAIFHEGDFGKEPMTIIFGKTPLDVICKVKKIIGVFNN